MPKLRTWGSGLACIGYLGGRKGEGRRRGRALGRGSNGHSGGGWGPANENTAQYLAAQQVAQPMAGAGGTGSSSSK